MFSEMHIGLHVEYLLFWKATTKLDFSQRIGASIKLYENPSSLADWSHACG